MSVVVVGRRRLGRMQQQQKKQRTKKNIFILFLFEVQADQQPRAAACRSFSSFFCLFFLPFAAPSARSASFYVAAAGYRRLRLIDRGGRENERARASAGGECEQDEPSKRAKVEPTLFLLVHIFHEFS